MNEHHDTTTILPRLLAERAGSSPDAHFLIEVEGRHLSYAAAFEEAGAWAAALWRHGVRAGDRVAVLLPTSINSVLAWIGAAWIGAINVPLNTAYRGDLLQHALILTEPKVLVVEEELTAALDTIEHAAIPSIVVTTSSTPVLGQLGLAEFLRADSTSGAPPMADHAWSDPATLMFTSGTTGPSKAVVMPWRQIQQSAEWVWQTRDAGPADRNYIPWPTNHISGAGGIYAMALVGGAAVLRRKWSTSRFMDDIFDHGCTMTTLMGAMVDYGSTMTLPTDRGPCPLERVFIAPVTTEAEQLMGRWGARYCTDYNSTELSGPIVSHHHEPVPHGSAGLQRPGAELRIVDEHGVDVPAGDAGELLVRTEDPDAMNAGYWNMPEASAKAWRDGWFHTGDLLRQDADGYFYFVGRLKDVIRVRGENVSAHELEQMINAFDGIIESAALGVPDESYEERIVLVIVAGPQAPDDAALLTLCRDRLPRFMIPSQIVRTDHLPKTPTGKVRKPELREKLASALAPPHTT